MPQDVAQTPLRRSSADLLANTSPSPGYALPAIGTGLDHDHLQQSQAPPASSS
jgi:hypothetical protein